MDAAPTAEPSLAVAPLPVGKAALETPIPLALGIALLLAGVFTLLRYRRSTRARDRSRANWLEVDAEIVDFKLGVDGGTPTFQPIYAFAAPGLRRVHAASPHDAPMSSRAAMGQTRTVRYNPDDARDFTADTHPDAWLGLWAGIALVAIGTATIAAWVYDATREKLVPY